MSAPLLEVRGLVKEFEPRGLRMRRRDAFRAVDDVSLEVREGETLAIVGESGSGKSTTARMMARLVDPTAGSVLLEGEDVTRAEGSQLAHLRRTMQFVFQDPYSSLNPRHDVERIISAPLRYQGLTGSESHRSVVAGLLERVGLLPEHARRYPHQFSGGQAQRIGIARALAVDPKVVVCDEAVSALDVSVQAQVIDLLRELQRDLGIAFVFIAHDLAVVRQIAHRVAVMQAGRIVEQGPTEQIFLAPREQYTKDLISAVPRIRPEWERKRRSREQW